MAARLTNFMIITVWKQPFWTECQKISKRICYANSFMESSHVFYLQSKYRNILFSVIMFCTCKWMYLDFIELFMWHCIHVFKIVIFSLILDISRNALWNISFNSKLCQTVSNRRFILENGCKKNELWIVDSQLLIKH